MLGFAGSSFGPFLVVVALLCLASSALVTDAMLRHCQRGDDRVSPER